MDVIRSLLCIICGFLSRIRRAPHQTNSLPPRQRQMMVNEKWRESLKQLFERKQWKVIGWERCTSCTHIDFPRVCLVYEKHVLVCTGFGWHCCCCWCYCSIPFVLSLLSGRTEHTQCRRYCVVCVSCRLFLLLKAEQPTFSLFIFLLRWAGPCTCVCARAPVAPHFPALKQIPCGSCLFLTFAYLHRLRGAPYISTEMNRKSYGVFVCALWPTQFVRFTRTMRTVLFWILHSANRGFFFVVFSLCTFLSTSSPRLRARLTWSRQPTERHIKFSSGRSACSLQHTTIKQFIDLFYTKYRFV